MAERHSAGGSFLDNLCHSLTAWALARTGLGRGCEPPAVPSAPAPESGRGDRRGWWSRARERIDWQETALVVVAANFPDGDLLLGIFSTEAYMLWHRGLTHSVLGLLIFPSALAALAHGLVPRIRYSRALVLCLAASLSHVLLDVPTSWGTLLLYPWSHTRYALDWVFIVDPVLWGLPLVGVLAGVGRGPRTRQLAALTGLVAVCLYVLAAGAIHGVAVERSRATAAGALPANAEGGRASPGQSASPPAGAVGDVEVFPMPLAPFRWHAIAWRGETLVHVPLSGLPPRAGEPWWELHRLGDPRVREALRTRAGQAYLWWARAPAGRVVAEDGGRTVVRLGDRRFAVRGADLFGMEIAFGEGGFLAATWEGDSVFTKSR